MAAPRVIRSHSAGSRSGWLKRSTEIRQCELRYVVAQTLNHHLIIEGTHCLAQLGQQVALISGHIRNRRGSRRPVGMRIKASQCAEEDLTLQAEGIPLTNYPRD